MGFWVEFAVEEALAVVQAFVATQHNLSPQQQADGAALVAAAQKFLADFAS